MAAVEGIQWEPWEERSTAAHSGTVAAGRSARRRSLRGQMLKRFSDNQEAFASSGELAPTRLGMAVEEQWPAFKLVGFGFYYAWIWVSYNSNVLVSPAAAYDLPPDTLSLTYLVSTLALGLSLIALALARDAARRAVASNGALGIIAVVVGLATVGTYASSSLGVEGNPLLIASAALTGIGTSAIVLRFGVIYAKVPAREATMYTAASFVFAMMIYFVAVGLPDPVGVGFTAALPALAVLSTLTNPEYAGIGSAMRPEGPRVLKGFFVRLLIAVAVFSVVVGVSRGFAVPHSSIAALNDEGSLVIFSTGMVAAVLFAIVGLMRRQFDVSRLYYPIIIAVAAGILVTPLLGGNGFGSQFVTVAYNCFVLVIWCLLAYVGYSSGLSSILVFGLGRGASALGTTIGWMGGLEIVRSQGDGSLSLEVISVAMVFALLVVSMLVLNDRLIGDALRVGGARGESGSVPVGAGRGAAHLGTGVLASENYPLEGSPHASEGSEAGCDDAQGSRGYASGCLDGAVSDGSERAAGEEQGDGVDQPRRPGRYQLRCDAAAERYGLSPRERDVFDLLVRGRSIEYIAQSLTISFNTAKSHIRHIYVKADVHSRQELQELLDREE